MGKREELKERHLRKQKIERETSGKLIEENHNGQDYTPEYARKVVAWRFFELWMKTQKYKESPGKLWEWFGRLREGLQDLLLHWPDSSLPRGQEFWLIYTLLGFYREGKHNELIETLYGTFGRIY